MSAFIVQVFRQGEWRRLTRVPVPEARNGDRDAALDQARLEVRRQIDGWRHYFTEHELRAVEAR